MQRNSLAAEIAEGLRAQGGLGVTLAPRPDAPELASAFPVSELVFASVSAAASALCELGGEIWGRRPEFSVDPALADGWFGMTLEAAGWTIPSPFDAVTGDYRARDGWIRLHTIADHHRAAALRVLGCEDRPFPLPVQALDHGTGYLMAAAALQALRARSRGAVLSAKLSLARTAYLLMPRARSEVTGESRGPLPTVPEDTYWGPARRLRFPVLLDGAEPSWPVEVGPLRCHEPAFSP